MSLRDRLVLSIAKDFSTTPGPRYEEEGDHSGEKFREELLVPKLREALEVGKELLVDLDGTAGYGTSFLEEAFGGLIREDGYRLDQLSSCLTVKSDDEDYLADDVRDYMREAEDARK